MNLARRPGPATRVRVREVTADGGRDHEDRLATEEPMEIRMGWPGRPADRVAVTMRTPGHDFELAAGFLHAEGLLAAPDDLQTIAYCTDVTLRAEQEFNVVTVSLERPPPRPPTVRYAGPAGATSACGVCGTESIDDVLAMGEVTRSPVWEDLTVPASTILALPDRLREAQRVFERTGGLHAAGLFRADGQAVVVREDVGRHNAVDKVVGSRLLAGELPGLPLLCVSGRIGFEIVQKAIAAGVGVLAAVGAPTSLAVDLATATGLTTVGFVGRGRFVIYSGMSRIGV